MNEIMVSSEVDHKNIEDYEIIFDDIERRSNIFVTNHKKEFTVHLGYLPLEDFNLAKKWIEAKGGELEVAKATVEYQKKEDKLREQWDIYKWAIEAFPDVFDGSKKEEVQNFITSVATAKNKVSSYEVLNDWIDAIEKMPRWFKLGRPDETVDRYYKFWDENTQNKDFLDNIEAIKQWYYGDRKAKPIVKIKEIEVRVEKEFDLFKLFEMDYQPDEETLFRLKIGIFEDPRVKACKDRQLKTALRKAADVHEVMARYWQIKEATKDQAEESAS